MPNLQKSLRSLKNPVKPSMLSGSLGLSVNVVNVPTRPGFSYVRLLGNTSEVIQAYNATVSSTFDVPVTVQWDGTKYVVLGRDINRYNTWTSSPYLPNHAYSHSLRGGDTLWVQSEQFTPLLVFPSGTSLQIASYVYNWNGAWVSGGNTGTSTIILPSDSTKQSVLLLYVDGPSGNPAWLPGTEAPSGLTVKNDLIPYLPAFSGALGLPVAMVRIPSGTTSFTWDNLYDIRQYFGGVSNVSGSSGGGIPEAPVDSNIYGRKNAGWAIVSGSSTTGSNYSLPTGSSSILGGFRVGVGLSIYPDGTLNVTGSFSTGTSSYSLPTGSASILGGFKVGSGLSVSPSGVLSAVGGTGSSSNILVYDDFNRANGAGVGMPQVGDMPLVINGASTGWGISSDHLVPLGTASEKYVVWGTGTARYILTATIVTIPVEGGILVRCSANGQDNYLIYTNYPGGKYTLFRRSGGSYSYLVSGTTQAPTNGDVVVVWVSETRIQVFVNSILEIDYMDATFCENTLVGFRVDNNDTTPAFDDLSVVRL